MMQNLLIQADALRDAGLDTLAGWISAGFAQTGFAGLKLTFVPVLPGGVLALLLVLMTALLIASLIRSRRGWVWRALSLLVLFVLLLAPVRLQEQREALPDQVYILTDRSPSMQLDSRAPDAEAATIALRERLAVLPQTEVVTLPFGQRSQGQGTTLPLADLLADAPKDRVGAVFVVSDGAVRQPEGALPADTPVHALITGNTGGNDRRITLLSSPQFGLVDESLPVRMRVDDLAITVTPPLITVRRDGEVLFRRSARPGEALTLDLPLAKAGRHLFEIEVNEVTGGDITTANNRAVLEINAVRERLRVLLISGQPSPNLRTWRNLLTADPSVDLVHFTILRTSDSRNDTPTSELSLIPFPVRQLFLDKLKDFDLVLFDQYPRRRMLPASYFENINTYVRGGGAVFVASGEAYAGAQSLYTSPMREVLPAEPTGVTLTESFRPALTRDGARHPVTAWAVQAQNTWGAWQRLLTARVNAAIGEPKVLLQDAEDRPVLLLATVGEGRIVQLLSDSFWLWTRGDEGAGGGPAAELLRRSVHWAMSEPELAAEQLQAEAKTARSENEDTKLRIRRQSLSEQPAPVTVRSPSGQVEQVPLSEAEDGRWTAELPVTEDGVYSLSDGELTAFTTVGEQDAPEFREPRATAEALRPLVAAQGGAIARVSAEGELPELREVSPGSAKAGEGWMGITRHEAFRVTGVESRGLLPAWLALLLAAGLALMAWWRESRL